MCWCGPYALRKCPPIKSLELFDGNDFDLLHFNGGSLDEQTGLLVGGLHLYGMLIQNKAYSFGLWNLKYHVCLSFIFNLFLGYFWTVACFTYGKSLQFLYTCLHW